MVSEGHPMNLLLTLTEAKIVPSSCSQHLGLCICISATPRGRRGLWSCPLDPSQTPPFSVIELSGSLLLCPEESKLTRIFPLQCGQGGDRGGGTLDAPLRQSLRRRGFTELSQPQPVPFCLMVGYLCSPGPFQVLPLGCPLGHRSP